MKSPAFILVLICTAMTLTAQNLTKQADSIRTHYHIPEMGYAVLDADKVLAMQVMGHHQMNQTGAQDTAQLSDYFHLGSNTKAITAFIAAYLVEQHEINWDTRFFDVFPEWKAQSDSAYYNITLKDLLSHRARVQPFTSGLELLGVPKAEGSTAERRTQFAAYVLKQKPVAKTTLSYTYSNAGYSIAAQMLEKVSGHTWEQLVETLLNQQLGLHARFDWPNRHDEHQPWGHWEENGVQTALPPATPYNLKRIEPAGDVSMTLPDYAQFIRLHLQGLADKFGLLKADTYQLMHYGLDAYAMGWGNTNKQGKKISFHDGSAGTFFCRCIIDNQKNQAYIIVANSATPQAQQGITALTALLRKTY